MMADAMTPEQLSKFMDRVCPKYGVCLPPDVRRSILDREVLEVNEIPRLLLESEGPGEWWGLHLLRSIRDELERFISERGIMEEWRVHESA
ncbi:MAG: hypothetical protein J0L73_03910 [Verrucomicrobia bacterium]|nr:hypothetical protein [Verrucomicrobiota bacterium]